MKRRTLQAAFTLIEMVVSLSIISIIFLAMGSVMVLASKAVPDPGAPTNLALDAADLLRQATDELRTAIELKTAEATVLEFVVPDRDGDDNGEQIKYQWSGVPGEPLTRQVNGGNTAQVLPQAYEFDLTYDAISVQGPPIITESSEVELSSHVGLLSFNDFAINDEDWIGQYFVPTGLPADAVSWSVTRVLFEAKVHGGNKGESLVQLRPALAGNRPDTTVLEQSSMIESNLASNYLWQQFMFSSVRDRAPGEGLCLVLKWVSDADAADVRFDDLAGSGMLTTSNGGGTWSKNLLRGMNYYVYGTYSAPSPPPPIDVLRSVTVTLNAGAGAASRARTSIIALNQPPMP